MASWYGKTVVWVVAHPRRPSGVCTTWGLPHIFVFPCPYCTPAVNPWQVEILPFGAVLPRKTASGGAFGPPKQKNKKFFQEPVIPGVSAETIGMTGFFALLEIRRG